MKWPYPGEGVDPWYDAFEAMVRAQDGSVLALNDVKNIILSGGGTISWNAGTGIVEWTLPIQLNSALSGFIESIPAGSLYVPDDGQYGYVRFVPSPQQNVELVMRATDVLPGSDVDRVYALFRRRQNKLYWRNGGVLASGESAAIIDDGPGGGGGGGGIGGTIDEYQIAFGTGLDTIGGSALLEWNYGTSILSLGDGTSTLTLQSTIIDTDSGVLQLGGGSQVSIGGNFILPADAGTAGYALLTDGLGGTSWSPVSSGGVGIGEVITGGTEGSVLFIGSAGVLAQDNANFFWNASTQRLGLGTTLPATVLDVRGTGLINDPIAEFSSPGSTDSNSIRVKTGAATASLFVAGGTDAFMPGTSQGDGGVRGYPNKKIFIGSDFVVPLVADTANNRVGVCTPTPVASLDVASGQLALPDGSAAVPALAFRDDLDTGIYSTAANEVAVATNGTNRVKVTDFVTTFVSTSDVYSIYVGSNKDDLVSSAFHNSSNGTNAGQYINMTSGPSGLMQFGASSVGTNYPGNDVRDGGAAVVIAAGGYDLKYIAETRSHRWYSGFNTANHLMSLTSTGLGVDTDTPTAKLDVASGQAAFPDGSAATPSLAFRDDLDTGIYSSTNGTINLSSNGVETARFYQIAGSSVLQMDTSILIGNIDVADDTLQTAAVMIAHADQSVDLTQEANAGGQFIGLRTRGSGVSQTAVGAGDGLSTFMGIGRTSAGTYKAGAFVSVTAEEAFTNTATGARISFWTTPNGAAVQSERMRITNAGNVGIASTSPVAKLDIGSGQVAIPDGSAAAPSLAFRDDLNSGLFSPSNDIVGVAVNGGEVARFQQTSTGNTPVLLMGTSTVFGAITVDSSYEASGTPTAVAGVAMIAHGAAGTSAQESYKGGQFAGIRTRGSKAAPSQVGADDGLLNLLGAGYTNASGYNYGALITFKADQAYTAAASGGRIEFHTTTNGTDGSTTLGGSTTERMRITNAGDVGIGTPAPTARLSVAEKFKVDANGNITRINDIPTSFPSTQGAAGSALVNNGSGTLSWVAPTDYRLVTLDTTASAIGNAVAFNGNLDTTNASGASFSLSKMAGIVKVIGTHGTGQVQVIGIADGCNFVAGLTLAAGDRVFLSTEAGHLTNEITDQDIQAEIGLVADASQYGIDQTASVLIQYKPLIFLNG